MPLKSTTPGIFTSFGPISSGDLLERAHVVAEDLHFDGLGRAFEVAQHVLENLRELDVDPGNFLAICSAQVVHHFLGAALACGARLHLDQHVAFVLLGGVEAQFRAGAARERVAVSGIFAMRCSICWRMRFVSSSEVPGGVK